MAELTAAFQNFAKTLKSVNAQEHDTTAQWLSLDYDVKLHYKIIFKYKATNIKHWLY
jgi:hypothetical protein